jgi:hypothetical protein
VSDIIKRYSGLFRGNERSHGVFDPKTKKVRTDSGPADESDFQKHIDGIVGLGVVPINDKDSCYFGAIDVDNHGSDKDIDLEKLSQAFHRKKLPVIVCRSKSGGAHCYVFFSEPVKSVAVRRLLNKWVALVNVAEYCTSGFEIFPKQDVLVRDDTGDKALGNWINLPYFGGDNTDRYALISGKKVNLDLFLANAESTRITSAEVLDHLNGDHSEAPPCIQSMLMQGVESGYRNQAMYNITVYLKRAFPEDYRDKAFDINQQVFDKPLAYAELKRTVGSAGRRDYRYKCSEEPCKSLCDRAVCVKRQFGISKTEFKDLENQDKLPEMSDMVRYDTDPVKWGIKVDGKLLNNITTAELYDANIMRMKISEALQIPVPMIANKFWYDHVIEPLMPNAVLEEAPPDASMPGVVWSRLKEFVRKADVRKDGTNAEDKKLLLTGNPVVHYSKKDDRKMIVFRATDFVQYLKRTKSEELKGPNLWFALKNFGGVEHTKVRVGKDTINVWAVPFDEEEKVDVPNFESEY